jgi:uncharacterized membrane protein YjfL (UPF0719 family)
VWDFSGDEVLFFAVAGVVALITTVRWYYFVARAKSFRPSPIRIILAIVPLILVIALLVVLAKLADPVYVAGKLDYTLLFTAGGIAWMFLAVSAFALLGVNVRDDALERTNLAAALSVAGGMIGVMLAYAGSNIGNGPTIWTTLLPAFVAALALLAAWGALEMLTDTAEAITVERDAATGVRVGAFLACAGLILGRSMAGDFDVQAGYSGTFGDFVLLGWPVAALVPAMVVLHHIARPTPQRPIPSVVTAGLIPAAALIALTLGYVLALGMPEVAPPGEYGKPEAVERAS